MLTKIISGGQTGADEGGLEGAYQLGLATGGTAPKDFLTENGPNLTLRDRYGLVEHASTAYPPRTRENAFDSDGTVWFGNEGSPGHKCTLRAAFDFKKPVVSNPTPEALAIFVGANNISVLNVAGNRESTNVGLHERVKTTIIDAFGG